MTWEIKFNKTWHKKRKSKVKTFFFWKHFQKFFSVSKLLFSLFHFWNPSFKRLLHMPQIKSCNFTVRCMKKGREGGWVERLQKETDKQREMSQTETERVCVKSVFSRSGVFDVGPSSAHMSSPSLPGNYNSVPLEPRWLLGETLSVWCSKEGSPMQFCLSSLFFSFVCDSSRLWQSYQHFHKSELILHFFVL